MAKKFIRVKKKTVDVVETPAESTAEAAEAPASVPAADKSASVQKFVARVNSLATDGFYLDTLDIFPIIGVVPRAGWPLDDLFIKSKAFPTLEDAKACLVEFPLVAKIVEISTILRLRLKRGRNEFAYMSPVYFHVIEKEDSPTGVLEMFANKMQTILGRELCPELNTFDCRSVNWYDGRSAAPRQQMRLAALEEDANVRDFMHALCHGRQTFTLENAYSGTGLQKVSHEAMMSKFATLTAETGNDLVKLLEQQGKLPPPEQVPTLKVLAQLTRVMCRLGVLPTMKLVDLEIL